MEATAKQQRRREQVRNLIAQSSGRFFGVRFVKRTDGSVRNMNARLGVRPAPSKTGRPMAYKPMDKGLLTVWDRKNLTYRMINLDSVLDVTVDGVNYSVQ
jgi:hypothetical protein